MTDLTTSMSLIYASMTLIVLSVKEHDSWAAMRLRGMQTWSHSGER
jgi:hypothetical protein